jgi:hypothetical protein
MGKQHRKPGVPLGSCPEIFGRHGKNVRIPTLTGTIELAYPDRETAARVVRKFQERLRGSTRAAVTLRGEFSLPLVLGFLDECFRADEDLTPDSLEAAIYRCSHQRMGEG